MAISQSDTTQITAQATNELFQAYKGLGTDEKLALLYYVYEEMGDSVTPAAPNAADPSLSENLITDMYELSHEDQLDAMRSIVEGKETTLSRLYGGLRSKNQLLAWYAWATEMGNRVVDIPEEYKATEATKKLLGQIKQTDFQEQISFLKEVASQMGYSEVRPPQSQAETGKTDSL